MGPLTRRRAAGQAIVELGFLALLLVTVLVGLVGVAELVQIEVGLTGVAEEAAHAAALAPSADLVEQRAQARGAAVAVGYALRNGTLQVSVDPSQFRAGGRVRAVASYRVSARDMPMLGWGELTLRREHTEPVPRYRSVLAR